MMKLVVLPPRRQQKRQLGQLQQHQHLQLRSLRVSLSCTFECERLIYKRVAGIVKQCPVIECPTGFKTQVKKQTKGSLYQSSMFSSYSSKPTKSAYKPPGFKKGRSKRTPKKSVWQNPFYKNTKAGNQKICTEFQCVSVKPPPVYMHSKKECPPASCPPGYIPVEDSEDYANKKCPKYVCEPQPPPDAICNVTGRTFNTFDGTEYKYDICNHILALDLENDEWEVSCK
jgi:von Willebrand factor